MFTRFAYTALPYLALTGPSMAQGIGECPEGNPITGFTCRPAGTVATGPIPTVSEGTRGNGGASLALIEELIEEDAEEDGGGSSADEAGGVDGGGFGLFVIGTTQFSDLDEEQEIGAESDLFGGLVGAEYVADSWSMGIGVDYSQEDIEFDRDTGETVIDEYGVQIFGVGRPVEQFFVIGAGRFAYSEYEMDRVAQPGNVARGETHGTEYGLIAGAGYGLPLTRRVALTLSAFIDYEKTEVDGFRETGATPIPVQPPPPGVDPAPANLQFEDDEYDSLTLILALDLSVLTFKRTNFALITGASFRYLHELEDDQRTIEALFPETGPTATSNEIVFETNEPDRNYFNVGASVTAVFGANADWSAFIDYNADVGHRFRDQHIVSAGVRREF